MFEIHFHCVFNAAYKFYFSGVSLGGVIGGYFYEKFGGVSTFKIFSSGSLLMGILHVLFIVFSKKNINRAP